MGRKTNNAETDYYSFEEIVENAMQRYGIQIVFGKRKMYKTANLFTVHLPTLNL